MSFMIDPQFVEFGQIEIAIGTVDLDIDCGPLFARGKTHRTRLELRNDPAVLKQDDVVLELFRIGIDQVYEFVPTLDLVPAPRTVQRDEQDNEKADDEHPTHQTATDLHRRRGLRRALLGLVVLVAIPSGLFLRLGIGLLLIGLFLIVSHVVSTKTREGFAGHANVVSGRADPWFTTVPEVR